MQGKIIKGIAGFYYVHMPGQGVFECRAKGIFRNQNIKPLVGDNVILEIVDDNNRIGNIAKVLDRKNQLIRPAVANVDQAIVVFATADPSPNLNLLDRFLVRMEYQQIPTIICFNKTDITEEEDTIRTREIYKNSGCPILFISVTKNVDLDELKPFLKNKTTVLAGPSGVGKSSLMNYLHPQAKMETGSISKKIKRGRHTTRHSELFFLKDGYLMDTPGFSSLELPDMEKEELKDCIAEFKKYKGKCRFLGCVHVHEPGCVVKDALENEKINEIRYRNYLHLFEELSEKKRY